MKKAYCSEECTTGLAGTSDDVDVWLLIEYYKSWGSHFSRKEEIPVELVSWINKTKERLSIDGWSSRAQLIRGEKENIDNLTLFIAFDGKLLRLRINEYAALEDLDLVSMLTRNNLFGGELIEEPVYFVCTNGERDICCAKFGLPVFQDLKKRYPERVWQTTHLGGHRFAPNVLVLPNGLLYGRVHIDEIDEFTQIVESRRIAFQYLRGRSSYPKNIQAAEVFVGMDGLRLLDVKERGSTIEVTFDSSEGKKRVCIRREITSGVLSSCSDLETSDVFSYHRVLNDSS